MKRLYLLRHAKSSWSDAAASDIERPLNARGKHDAPIMGQRCVARGFVPDRILASPAARTRATALLMARALDYPARSIVYDDELYLADAATLLAVVLATKDAISSLMLVGHNPGLTDLANMLTPQRVDNLPTCALFCADFAIERWRDIERGRGTLVCFDYPKNPHPD